MDIKKANVNLLLKKVGKLLEELPAKAKKEKNFSDAEKALAKLQDLFAGKDGEIEVMACSKDIRVIHG